MNVNIHTVSEQIEALESLGMQIGDRNKAEEILSDIGFYRLGFYWFPFEKKYPSKENRDHIFREGTSLYTIVRLYYFDFDLRHILMKYISRIEIHLKTTIVNIMSQWHMNTPNWFVNDRIVAPSYAKSFDTVYDRVRLSPYIKAHHHKHACKYAPARKTLEFMTFGDIIDLLNAITDVNVRLEIAHEFGIKSLRTFDSYLCCIKRIRNRCAHGGILFDYIAGVRLLGKGPVDLSNPYDRFNLNGAIKVIDYLLSSVSSNRAFDMNAELKKLIEGTKDNPSLFTTVSICSGLK